jgi:hypothetical protein
VGVELSILFLLGLGKDIVGVFFLFGLDGVALLGCVHAMRLFMGWMSTVGGVWDYEFS